MIETQRHRFDIPTEVAYFNCAYMAPLMDSVAAAGQQGIARKVHPWTITAQSFFTESEETRARFARLINTDPNDIAITPSASYGIACAARNLNISRGQSVVMLEDQFPSNVTVWREQAKKSWGYIKTVAITAHECSTEAVIQSITEDTAVAALPQCRWSDGLVLDLARIGQHCRNMGTALVLDLTQSVGVLPFDVQRVQPDFVATACYKWLLGPYSLGFLYAAPAHQQGQPLEYNWITREGSENFAALAEHAETYQPGARRFDMGERANFHLLPMAAAALDQISAWGVEKIAATLAEKNCTIAARALDIGLLPVAEHRRAGHFLCLEFPKGVPSALVEKLQANQVYVSVRGRFMRLTPHLYNTDEDVDRLFDALEGGL